ncbi:Protein of unknown function [Cotesia congregata]|uniref:Uncharacterized protein n=1 Tax=Cotesia congregata TaxID=51543 RepID=A0A8J2HL46_COTCN|nr:Protein of unknown function [Cotesia congregata]
MPPTKQKMQEFTYALIWFISTRERFVVETSKLPKTRRKKGNVVKIIWEDPSTLISQRFDVKILELGSDKNQLENIVLDEDGNICDDSTKAFFRSVLDKKRSLQEELKEGNKASKIQKTSLEHIISKKKPLFELNGCSSKNQKTSTPSMKIDKPVIKISPQLNNSEQSNLTEIDLLQSNQSSVNNSKNNQSSPIETDEPYSINILPSTSGVQKFVKNQEQVNNESKKVTKDIEVLVSDTEDMGALHTFLPVTASEENKKFLKQIYAGLSAAYQYQNTKMSKMIKSFKVNGENKKEISPNSHIYFPIKLIESIEQSAVTETGMIDWKKILKLALMEIYGNSIANYSAIGRNKNSRPPIDHDIYEGIFRSVATL